MPTGVVSWTYGDWRRQATDVAKRDQLILHIEEVEGFIVRAEGRGARRLELQESYLPRMEALLKALEDKIENAANTAHQWPRKTRVEFT